MSHVNEVIALQKYTIFDASSPTKKDNLTNHLLENRSLETLNAVYFMNLPISCLLPVLKLVCGSYV